VQGDVVLTAGAPFSGASVVANSGHRNKAFNLSIEIAKGVNAGCGAGELNSAIGFVLDKEAAEEWGPETPDHDGRIYPKSRLRVWGIDIDREPGAEALCHAIDFRREPEYDAIWNPATYDDAVVGVKDVLIGAGTYTRSAIRMAGFTAADGGGRWAAVGIVGVTVMPSAADSVIEFGPVYGSGEILENVLTANGGNGIRVYGSNDDDIVIDRNYINGAQTAILVDDQAYEVLFKSNVLTGDGVPAGNGVEPDTGICSDALFNDYKSNRIRGFDEDIKGDCTPAP
jgi:hypothetical protein